MEISNLWTILGPTLPGYGKLDSIAIVQGMQALMWPILSGRGWHINYLY